MPIPSEIVSFPFAGGIDQKTDPWLIDAPRLTTLINGCFTKQGQIRKRLGYNPLSKNVFGGGTLTAAARVGFRKSEQFVIDGANFYAYSPTQASQSNPPWTLIDQVPELTAKRAIIDSAAVTAADADCGYVPITNTTGFEIYVWTNGTASAAGDVFVTVIDTASGAPVYRSLQLTSGATFIQPKVAVLGTIATVVYIDSSASPGFVRSRRIDLSGTAGWVAQQTLRSDVGFNSGATPFDIISLDDRFIIAYQALTGPNFLMLASFTNVGGLIGALPLSTEVAVSFAGIGLGFAQVHTDSLLVFYSTGAAVKNAWVSGTTLIRSAGPFTYTTSFVALNIGIAQLDASTAIVVMNAVPAAGIAGCYSTKVTLGGAAISVSHSTFGLTISSRPFLVNGRAYALGYIPSTPTSATMVTVDLQTDQNNSPPNHRPVATIAPRVTSPLSLGSGLRTISNSLAATPTIPGGWFSVGLVLRSNTPKANLGLSRVSFVNTETNRFQLAEIGENVHLSGGVPSYYDGRGVYECGFLSFIDSTSVVFTPSTTGGGMASGAYVYSMTYEITDAAGQRHRSATSVQTLVTVGGSVTTGSVAITNIPYLGITNRQDNNNLGKPSVEIVIYRSVVGGTTLYRLTPENTVPALQNFTSTKVTSYTDAFSDASAGAGVALATMPLIYTTGGVLDNVCPPSATIAIVHRSRVWLAGTDDPRVVWFSKQFVTGDAIAFCDQFTFAIEDRNPLTALGSLDDKLVIFTRSSIYIVTGDGPTDSGVGNDLSSPQRVASDVGCIEPRSVVLMPDGLMFQSEEGIMLLDRSMAVSYIGHPVEDTLASLPLITSAVVKGDQNQVAFTCQNTQDAHVGGVFTYDYIQRAWSVAAIYDADQGTLAAAFQSAARSPSGVYTGVTPYGQVMTERPATDAQAYLDGSHWITLTIGGAWVKIGALQGYQRVRRAGIVANQVTRAALIVSFAFDYNPATSQTENLTDSQVNAATHPVTQPMFRVGCQNGASPRCESMQVTISDATPTVGSIGNGLGLTFTGLAFEIARKPGLRRVGATAKW